MPVYIFEKILVTHLLWIFRCKNQIEIDILVEIARKRVFT